MKPKKIHFFLFFFLLIQVIVLQILENQPNIVERYYSNGIYPTISIVLRFLFGWIPFSFGDILLFYLIYKILRFIISVFTSKFKNWVLNLFQMTSFISLLFFGFYFLWGYNYFRAPLSQSLNLEQRNYTTEELSDLSNYLIENLNTIHRKIVQNDTLLVTIPYSHREIYQLADNGYDALSVEYPEFSYKVASVKSSIMSLLQTYNGTSGYFNPFTGEAQVNNKIPKTGYPTTTCHEMAHQLGYAAENEANFIGFLAAVNNEDLYFKYSAYRMATRYVIFELYKRDVELYSFYFKKINTGIVKDFAQTSAFWNQYKNPFEPIVKKGYNAYLKANKQTKGIDSYNYVVNLLISYYSKTGVLSAK